MTIVNEAFHCVFDDLSQVQQSSCCVLMISLLAFLSALEIYVLEKILFSSSVLILRWK